MPKLRASVFISLFTFILGATSATALDGELDPSFGDGGGVLLDLSVSFSENDSRPAAILFQPMARSLSQVPISTWPVPWTGTMP